MGLVLLGLVSSNLLTSIGTIWLVILAFLDNDIKSKVRRFVADPVSLGLSAIFFVYLIGGIGSADQSFWLDKVRVKLPFLLLPFAFVAMPDLSRKSISQIMGFFVLLISASAILVLIRYATQSAEYTQTYIQGMVMPTPINHIRYSLIVSFAMAASIWLGHDSVNQPWRSKVSGIVSDSHRTFRWICYGIALFLFIFLHILAVRSGLLAAYLVLAYRILHWIVVSRQYRLGAALLISAVMAIWAAQEYIPTLHNRMAYSRYDLEQYLRGEANPDLSDAKRIGSIHAGISIFADHPLTGVGIGNIKPALKAAYQRQYPDLAQSVPLPHNQFVFIAACTGIAGLAVFLWGILAPFFVRGALRHTLFVSLQLIILSSMLTEATLETQLGLTFYLIFLLIIHRFLLLAEQTLPDENAISSKQPAHAAVQAWQKDA